MEGRKPVIADHQRELIVKQADVIGEDGLAMIQDIEDAALNTKLLPADVFKMIESCMASLSQKVGVQMQSDEVTRQKEPERLKQIEAIREQATMLHGSRLNRDKPTEESVVKTMREAVNEYMAAVDQDKEDGLDPDTARLWKEQVQEIVALANLDMPVPGTRERAGADPTVGLPSSPQGRHRPGAVHRVCSSQGADRPRGNRPTRIREAIGELKEGDHGPEQRSCGRSIGERGDGGDPAGK